MIYCTVEKNALAVISNPFRHLQRSSVSATPLTSSCLPPQLSHSPFSVNASRIHFSTFSRLCTVLCTEHTILHSVHSDLQQPLGTKLSTKIAFLSLTHDIIQCPVTRIFYTISKTTLNLPSNYLSP